MGISDGEDRVIFVGLVYGSHIHNRPAGMTVTDGHDYGYKALHSI